MTSPFYYRIRQPFRGLLAVLFVIVVGAIFYYIGTQKFWWPAPAKPISFIALPLYLLILFPWIFMYEKYFHFWPWNGFSQPARGIGASITVIVSAGVHFYILNNMAHWGAYMFDIASAWLFWIFMCGPFLDSPWDKAYKGKQPITGISGMVSTFGLALITFWIIPEEFLGQRTGLPFTWFTAAVLMFFVLKGFPVQIGLPARALAIPGWFAALAFVEIWAQKSIGADPFAETFPAGTEPMKGALFMTAWLMAIQVPVGLFQMWPFHRFSPLKKGFLWIVLGTVIGALVYWLEITISLDPPVTAKVVTWSFCLFIGFFLYYVCLEGEQAPDPAADLARAPESVPEAKAYA